MNLQIEYYGFTHLGLRRSNNQDCILMNPEEKIFAVADGLGGHLGGEVASALALGSFNEFIGRCSSKNEIQKIKAQKIMKNAFEQANKDVFEQGQKHSELKGMGTTLAALWVHGNQVYIGNVGDSRGYLFREGQMWQITSDQNLFAPRLKQGFEVKLKEYELKNNSLTQSVGFLDHLYPDIFVRSVTENDIYLLCSDGLHGMVPNEQILDIFQSEDLNNIPKMCTIKALSYGGLDNISVVVVKMASC